MVRFRSVSPSLRKPNPMFSTTFSHGKTPFSWKTKIRRASGPVTGSPSTSTSPEVASRNPATMLSSVDFPHPLGPTRQTNSPGATSALTFSRTSICSPGCLPGKLMETFRIETAFIIRASSFQSALALCIPPTHLVEFFQLPHEKIEDQTDEADHDHAGDDEVVAFSGIARVDNQITETAVDRDHFGGHNHEPGDAQRDANSGNNLRQAGAENDLPKKLAPAQTEGLGGAQINWLHGLHRRDCRNRDRKNASQEN